MTRLTLAIAGLLALLPGGARGADEDLFPFVISYDAPDNATNVAAWLHRPAGRHGFVRAKEGRLATDAGPIRFWATNLCFEACFPTHEQAERVARRMARLGINCVRMHHMDSHSIWGDSPDKLTIDPKKLERLDYLIDQLKRQGIYTNINLHVSRWFDVKEGFPHRQQRPNYDKGLDNFEPRMIELQKKYARDLLAHVNPYTKTAYAREPAVAFVEINNENALWAQWGWGQLDDLPDPYATTFRKLWNQWLREKYQTTGALAKAWNAGQRPLGAQIFRNGDLAQPLESAWHLERDGEDQAQWSVQPGEEGKRILRLVVHRPGKIAWHPQFNQGGLKVEKDTPYTLSFRARAEKPGKMGVNCMMAHEPWEPLGFYQSLELQRQWKQYRFTFVLDRDDPNARITFTQLAPNTYEFADFSLQPGGIVGLLPDQRLEDDSVPVLKHGALSVTRKARFDFADFLSETERDYWWGMYKFLKDELGVQSLVSGTQLNYSPVHVQAGLDYIDAHSYWHHPHFPNRPWDSRDWYVVNAALVNSTGGTLAGLAGSRVAGMPYTVSEYNHPAPIQYSAEGFPMIAAFGGLQSWDGIFTFTYSHGTEFEPRKVDNFFDIKGDAGKLAHHPASAAMFLRGDVEPAKRTLLVPLSPPAEQARLRESLSAWQLNAQHLGIDNRLSLVHGLAVDPRKDASQAALPTLAKSTQVFVSDTGQIRWDASQEGAGYFTVDTPRTKLFTGFVRDRSFALGEVALAIGKTRLDWATVSLVALDGERFDKRGRILIAATGLMKNRDAQLEELGDNRVTLRNRWGSEPLLCEGVPATLTLPVKASRVQFYPLDERGERRSPAPVRESQDKCVLELGPRWKTLWYEAVIRD